MPKVRTLHTSASFSPRRRAAYLKAVGPTPAVIEALAAELQGVLEAHLRRTLEAEAPASQEDLSS